jgi:hypothetical protein
MSEAEALDRALVDFGGPEQVRTELEATHGHRLLPVVIDKAMQWKEKTMKAKWLWITWVHLVLLLVIALEVLSLTFASVFLVPKFEKFVHDGLIDPAVLQETPAHWIPSFLRSLKGVADYTTWMVLGVVVAGGLFEWRIRGENKSFIRLSALGTLAAALMVAVVLAWASLTLPFFLGLPDLGRVSAPMAREQMATVDTAASVIERAIPNKDWEAIQENVNRASRGVDTLANMRFAHSAMTSPQQKLTVDDLRERLNATKESLREAQQAIQAKDAGKLEAAMKEFRQSYGPVREAAKKSER